MTRKIERHMCWCVAGGFWVDSGDILDVSERIWAGFWGESGWILLGFCGFWGDCGGFLYGFFVDLVGSGRISIWVALGGSGVDSGGILGGF